jgi:hypothetical protein
VAIRGGKLGTPIQPVSEGAGDRERGERGAAIQGGVGGHSGARVVRAA